MLTVKKLAVLTPPVGPLLTSDQLVAHQQALSLLQMAEQQAQARLAQAEEEAEALLAAAQARADEAVAAQQQAFVARAEELFADWQEQQQKWQEALIPRAEALLQQAMGQLLAELPEEARLEAMLRQLQQAQGRQTNATLSCAPARLAQAESWLEQRPLEWQLVADSSLPSDTLRLATDNGELSLSWVQVEAALIPS
ncbi:type III secretion system stator protein SctL [Kalamiella sp. sgz302252]|uniref:type III secretion system stator protein SctL n=1 Tax=Pantoea sp. sgz302252 TaxID=3341827 RepID=UPI0036D3D50D